MTVDWGALGLNLAVSAAAAAAVLGATAAVGFAKRRHRVVDGAWGLGFAAVAAATFAASADDGDPVRRWIVLVLTAAWGVRLSAHLIVRNWGEPEDHRYERMLEGAGPAAVLAKVYLLQGLLIWVVSLPVQVAQYDPDPVGFPCSPARPCGRSAWCSRRSATRSWRRSAAIGPTRGGSRLGAVAIHPAPELLR
ncbi:hypothetical protein GCM10029992_54330 [Glycomyces albus]